MQRVLEQHEYHHDGEDLERVAGHVHHDCVHGELFCGREGDFPRFLHFQDVGFFGGGRFARLGLGELGALEGFGLVEDSYRSENDQVVDCERTLLVEEAEKPGGSRIEDADFVFGLGGEWSSRTHEGYDDLGVIVVMVE